MSFEHVFRYLGGFGAYQQRIYGLLCFPTISCAFHKLAGVFILARPDFRCVLPYEAENTTFQSLSQKQWKAAYPRDSISGNWRTCEYYDQDESVEEGVERRLIKCDKYVYDKSFYENTAVMEWDLVCDRNFLAATSDSVFMIGVLLGSIIFGYMSDKVGRRPTFFTSLVIQMIFGVLAGFAPDYITYTIARMIVGATTSGVFLVGYVLALEMVGTDYRMAAGVGCQMFFSLGFILTPLFGVGIRDWRKLQVCLTLPSLIFLSYYWFIPESARWLFLKERNVEAINVIEEAARINEVSVPQEFYDWLIYETAEKKKADALKAKTPSPGVLDLFRYPNLRRKTLLIFFDWFVNSGVYYGLSWNTNNLGGNLIVNFMIAGFVELPAYGFLILTLNRWGRRTILCGTMLAGGISLLLTIVVPSDMEYWLITFAMFGKLAITASYGTVYIFTAEQFPTVVRNVGLGASSMVARIGGICAPYLNLLGQFWRPLPLIICGALAVIGGLLSLLLPETLNSTMLETIEDGEKFGKKREKPSAVENAAAGEELDILNTREATATS